MDTLLCCTTSFFTQTQCHETLLVPQINYTWKRCSILKNSIKKEICSHKHVIVRLNKEEKALKMRNLVGHNLFLLSLIKILNYLPTE